MRIRVLLADDEGLERAALTALLNLEGDLDVVASAVDTESAVASALAHTPDVVVAGLRGLDGFAVARDLARLLPTCAVVVLTGAAGVPDTRQALVTGARGVLPKSSRSGVLADVVRHVHAGGRYLHPAVAADVLVPTTCPLTPRELEVLRLTAYDTPVAEVARRLRVTPGTVRNYLSSAVAKLNVADRSAAVATAHDNGWL
ncbi:response regulator transcription factor [Saccharothrix mutabilis subsp. mutabilis]|uniref:Response regulator transcription factor n=1 Tax=Saccharothrix mutabilis subsp. mutabilis TaxID=66855 RepID=A0ABP3DFZ9_9PSEU